MKFLATLLIALANFPSAASAQEPAFDPSQQSAYAISASTRTAADETMAKADAIFDSKFASGSPLEYNKLLREAAITGHPKAQFMLCVLNSNEMLGTAFFRDGYVWCKLSAIAHRTSKPQISKDSEDKLSYLISRLKKEGLAFAQENEDFILGQMKEASLKASQNHP